LKLPKKREGGEETGEEGEEGEEGEGGRPEGYFI
jgi:hypothetical protein